MAISLIVAASLNNVIGNKGRLPWSLPAEMTRFKQITIGHPIIMGRKTHESIGRPLPGRQNIIISRNQNYTAQGCEVVPSFSQALTAAKEANEIFVIGGEKIYALAMPLADKLYLTRVNLTAKGNKHFNMEPSDWRLVSSEKHPADEKNIYDFEFQQWIRR